MSTTSSCLDPVSLDDARHRSILLVALFGSVARGDSSPTSDLDLLFVTREDRHRQVTRGNVTVYHYPWKDLKQSAQKGALFLCHLIREARALFDPEERLETLRETFQFKTSYDEDIRLASDLGWFLVHHGTALNPDLVARRIAWCVRTILIARSVADGKPVFSTNELVRSVNSPHVEELIAQRREGKVSFAQLNSFALFLNSFGASDPGDRTASPQSYLKVFHDTANGVAIQTLQGGAGGPDYRSWDAAPVREQSSAASNAVNRRVTRAHIAVTDKNDLVVLTSSSRTPTKRRVERVTLRLGSDSIKVETAIKPTPNKAVIRSPDIGSVAHRSRVGGV